MANLDFSPAEPVSVKKNEGKPSQKPIDILWKHEFFLCVVSLIAAFLIQIGALGFDTEMRLQVTHSLWTDAPAVVDASSVWPAYGTKGVNGTVQSWYGIGHSLLMLPADIIATGILSFTGFRGDMYDNLKNAAVGYLVFPLLSMLAILVSFKLLKLLGFSSNHATFGALGLLFCTTFMQYTQKNGENSMLLLFLLCGYYFITRWLNEGSIKFLIAGAFFPGYNLLARLPNVCDLAVIFLYAAVILFSRLRAGTIDRKKAARAFRELLISFGGVFIFFLFWDRYYQWSRFGSVFSTYLHIRGVEHRAMFPDLPSSYPFSTPFFTGFLGALFSPRRSIFLFDPLLAATIYLFAKLWRRIGIEIKALAASLLLLLLAMIVFYATFFNWGGAHAWGDRFVVVPVELLSMLGIALLANNFRRFRLKGRVLTFFFLALSLIIQIASTVFASNLEEWQANDLGYTFVVGLRFANMAAVLFGKAGEWGLNRIETWEDFSNPFYMPFRVSRLFPGIAANILIGLWILGTVLLVVYLALFVFRAKRNAR